MKKVLEKMASFMIGSIMALLTWDAVLLACVTDGRLKALCTLAAYIGVCLTVYWMVVPRELDRRLTLRKKRAARRTETR